SSMAAVSAGRLEYPEMAAVAHHVLTMHLREVAGENMMRVVVVAIRLGGTEARIAADRDVWERRLLQPRHPTRREAELRRIEAGTQAERGLLEPVERVLHVEDHRGLERHHVIEPDAACNALRVRTGKDVIDAERVAGELIEMAPARADEAVVPVVPVLIGAHRN